jgi:Lipase (class 3)
LVGFHFVKTPEILKAAEMGCLSGAIYEDTVPRTHNLQQTIVARGMTEDVSWMITDSIADQSSFGVMKHNAATPFVVRTITIRGYDASDAEVDRVRLLNLIADASPERIRPTTSTSSAVVGHSGLLKIARAIYKDVKPFIEWTAPHHKIVLNGHSIGGSVSLFILFLMTLDKGADFTKKKVIKVYTFGSPPIVRMESKPRLAKDGCEVLEAFDLPSCLVMAYVQPWDPIIRQFSEIDSLYPLIEDIGEDGVTLWVNGPNRALRPITKAIAEAWNGWPCFRDTAKEKSSEAYIAVGIQHLMLPDPTRYLADRFLAVNIAVPPVATILRISPSELYRALETVFPLDVFEVSYIPQAIRSFVHHFYPAYGLPIMDYVKELQRQSHDFPERNS